MMSIPLAPTVNLRFGTSTTDRLMTESGSPTVTSTSATYTYTYTIQSGDNGRLTYYRSNVRDRAGNTGISSSDSVLLEDPAGSIDRIIADTTAPSAPEADLTEDTGTTPNYTSNGEVVVSDIEANATWEYRVDTDGNASDNLSNASWTDGTGSTIAASMFGGDGLKRVQVRQTDRAGNVSSVQNAFVFTIDTSPPAAPTALDLAAADDTCADFDGTSGCDFGTNSDDTTSQTTGLTISFTGEEHATVQLKKSLLGGLATNVGSASSVLPSGGVGSIDISPQ